MITLIVVNWNNQRVLELCLKAFAYYNEGRHALILIDNGSTDNSVDWMNSAGIPHVALPKNCYHEQGINVAMQLVDTRYALLIDTDTEVKCDVRLLIDKLSDKCPVLADYRDWTMMGETPVVERVAPWFCLMDMYTLRRHYIDVFHRYAHEIDQEGGIFDIGSFMLMQLKNERLDFAVPPAGSFYHAEQISSPDRRQDKVDAFVKSMLKYDSVNIKDRFYFKWRD